MMMSFKDFNNKYILKKSNINYKDYQVLFCIGLDNVGMYLGDRLFSSDIGILNIHSSKRRHWVAYKKEKFF